MAIANTDLLDQSHHERSLERAQAQADLTGSRVFLRFSKSLENQDIWPHPGLSFSTGELRVAWADGREGQSFWAVGLAAEIRCAHLIRFAQAHKGCSEFCEQTLDVPLSEEGGPAGSAVPLAVGGFAFTPRQVPSDDVWEGWEDGALWVPRLLFFRSASDAGVSLTLVVEPGQALSELRRELVVELARLEEEVSRLSVGELSESEPQAFVAPLLRRWTPEERADHRQSWCARAEKARRAIRAGKLDKVVLARSQEWTAPAGSSFDALQTAHRLREQYPTCKVFLIQREDGSSFVGATPELLVGLKGENVQAVSLAGTTRRGVSEEEDAALGEALVASAKEQHEHRLVTDAIRRSFEPVVEDLVIAEEPHLLRLQNVQHLETPIQGRLDRTRGIMELVSRLHPTPAVGGTPAHQAQRWLQENENLERGWYAGVVGWVTPGGDGQFAVAIRSALLRPDRAWAFAGAGLVADSDPGLEWEETNLKLQAMSRSLVVRPVPVERLSSEDPLDQRGARP